MRQSTCRGFTLIELLVTLALAAILSTIAVPSIRALVANQALSNSASDFLSALIQARSAALKNNQRTIIQPITNADWRTGWRVYVDTNSNATYDENVDTLVLTRQALSGDISIVTTTGFQASVQIFGFGSDGFLSTISGSNAGSVVMQSSYTSRRKYVSVSRLGRGRICDPVQSPGCEPDN